MVDRRDYAHIHAPRNKKVDSPCPTPFGKSGRYIRRIILIRDRDRDRMSMFENFVAMVEGWTVEERGQVLGLLGGMAASASASASVVAVTPVKKAATVAKTVAPKAPVKAPRPLPTEGIPVAADYRLEEADIDETVCIGRVFLGTGDNRFRPAVQQEGQCGGAVVEGGDLCATCQRRMEKYAEAEVEKPGPWLGRVTEEPMPWCNMLDSAKLLAKPPKWLAAGGSSASSVAGSEEGGAASEASAESEGAEQMSNSSSSSSTPAPAPAPKKPTPAEKAAALAEKAKVAAEKAAAAALKKEEAATKKAEAATKKAEAAAKKAEKAAAPPKKAATTVKKVAAGVTSVMVPPPTSNSAAASSAEPVVAEGEFDMLDGELRFVRDGNVYEFDSMTEKVGCFLGRKTADGTIDVDAEEVGAAEVE